MSDGGECGCGSNHEKHPDRVHLELTPSGVRLDMLGVLYEMWKHCDRGEWAELTELIDVMGVLLAAAYRGDFKWIDNNYEEAVVAGFRRKLADVEDVAAAIEGEGK